MYLWSGLEGGRPLLFSGTFWHNLLWYWIGWRCRYNRSSRRIGSSLWLNRSSNSGWLHGTYQRPSGVYTPMVDWDLWLRLRRAEKLAVVIWENFNLFQSVDKVIALTSWVAFDVTGVFSVEKVLGTSTATVFNQLTLSKGFIKSPSGYDGPACCWARFDSWQRADIIVVVVILFGLLAIIRPCSFNIGNFLISFLLALPLTN